MDDRAVVARQLGREPRTFRRVVVRCPWGLPAVTEQGVREDNVLFATWYDGLAPLPENAALSAADFDRLLALREEVSKTLEPMRAAGDIGAALDAVG